MGIIEELDKEGINLQETILNLERQGYISYYDMWLERLINNTMFELTLGIAIDQLKKNGLWD